jgi:peptidoglycan/LPS O-acetylase OafA/YrhL
MTSFHRWLGTIIVLLFVVIMLWALVLLILRRDETPDALRAVQHWTENLLLIQTAGGILLVLLGRRVVGPPDAWLHYFYGSLFPLIAMVGGRLAALRRERRGYVGLAWGAFFAFGLTLRAVQTSCGVGLADLASCMIR